MLRRTQKRLPLSAIIPSGPNNVTIHYRGPITRMPVEYQARLANAKEAKHTDKRDPKNRWGLWNLERGMPHPSHLGTGRHNHGGSDTKGGAICDVPPVPVYRKQVMCNGGWQAKFNHPPMFIKCPPGRIVNCKWCRAKFINCETEEDNDNDWRRAIYEIATTPETLEDLLIPWRGVDGVLRQSLFQDGKTPHPDVYRSVFDPTRFKKKLHGIAKNSTKYIADEEQPLPKELIESTTVKSARLAK